MNVPLEALQGASGVSISVEKQEDGTYLGRCMSMPQLPPQPGRDQAEAINLTMRQIERFVSNGFRK